jgi:hypothetical protein
MRRATAAKLISCGARLRFGYLAHANFFQAGSQIFRIDSRRITPFDNLYYQ